MALRLFLWVFFLVLASSATHAAEPVAEAPPDVNEAGAPLSENAADETPAADARIDSPDGKVMPGGSPTSVYVIPVKDEVGRALLFVIRRGMKDAITKGANVIVLDMDTPGGRLDVTLEIMEMMARFDGETITYVNTEAISAGSFIAAATGEIWYAPQGIIGAAAPVAATGQEIPETMKLKLMSYLTARLESFTEGKPFRTEVIRAMMDEDYVLEIDGETIKGEGALLTLTAPRAMEEYGDPPQPLLGNGIADDLDQLLVTKFGEGGYVLNEFVPTWSEELARWLTAMSPLLLGIGLICIFFEAKTPGFGVIGVTGIILLALVFFGHHLAGLSGLEPLLIFLLGVLLVLAEVLFFPGLLFPSLIGIAMMIGALIWGMADIWPGDAFELTPEMFIRPVVNLAVGLLIGVIGMLAIAKFLPRSWLWDKLILQAGITGDSQGGGSAAEGGMLAGEIAMGTVGVAVTDLYPSGEIEIDGRRYQARLDYGTAVRGDQVEVTGRSSFGLLVRLKSR